MGELSIINNILIGVPLECPEKVVSGLKSCARVSLGRVENIKVVRDEISLLKELKERAGIYKVVIVVDPMGSKSVYVPYLQCVRKLYPEIFLLLVCPISQKGTKQMGELLDAGIYNALFQNELSVMSMRSLFQKGRVETEAAAYYGVNISNRKQKSYGLIVRDVRGISIARGGAEDFGEFRGYAKADDDWIFSSNDESSMDVQKQKTITISFPLEEEWVSTYKGTLKNYYRGKGIADLQAFENGRYNETDFRNLVSNKMRDFKMPMDRSKTVIDSFIRDIVSYGKIDILLEQDEITDIKLNNKDSVTVQCRGVWYNTNITFKDEEEFSYFISKICTKNHAAVNATSTQVVFSDSKTCDKARLRITVAYKSINSSELTTASIRKVNKRKKLASELIEEKLITKEQAALLISAVKKGKSIIISGGSGSGKTVLLNCLMEYLADNISGVCIQEADELFAHNKVNLEFQHSLTTVKGKDKISVSLKELATQGLLKNAQVFIIGEIKGDEAEDFFTASNTGAQVLCTTHSNSGFGALDRLVDLGRGAGYDSVKMLEMMARNIDLIVHMERYSVKEILGVVGWDSEKKCVIYDKYFYS